MATWADRWVATHAHTYQPDPDLPVDPAARSHPCVVCGRFARSVLHQEVPTDD